MIGRIKPCGSLKLGAREVSWAEWSCGWIGRPGHRCVTEELQDGVLRPAPIDPNIQDLDSLVSRVKKVTQTKIHKHQSSLRSSMTKPIVLVLPDLSVRALVLRLDALPARAEEQATLIRWRLGQEQLFPLGGSKIVFHQLTGSPVSESSGASVLAVAIRESVLAQYEEVCERLGMNPVEVDITTFRLFNFWSQYAKWQRSRGQDDLLWVSLIDGGLTVMIFHGGQLIFLRNKLLKNYFGFGGIPFGGDNPEVAHIVEEILASITVCMEMHPEVAISRLVIANESQEIPLAEELGQHFQVGVEEVTWEQVRQSGWKACSGKASFGGLMAIAGLLGR